MAWGADIEVPDFTPYPPSGMVLLISAPGVEIHQYLATPHLLYFWLLALSNPDTASQWPSSSGWKYGKAERTLALA